MDVHAAIGGERTIRRVIALLVAFAVLAERASGRSAPVRLLVLWILRRAARAAETFVFEWTGVPPILEGIDLDGIGSDDAQRLAARFRALAAALCALLPLAHPFGRRRNRRGLASGPSAPDPFRRPSAWKLVPNDTS